MRPSPSVQMRLQRTPVAASSSLTYPFKNIPRHLRAPMRAPDREHCGLRPLELRRRGICPLEIEPLAHQVTFVLLLLGLKSATTSRRTAISHSPELDPAARAKVAGAVVRMEHGNLSNVKSVGEGVLEYRIDFGPGYRVYFGQDGQTLVILLTGGTKKRQQRDIDEAHAHWLNYKQSQRGRR